MKKIFKIFLFVLVLILSISANVMACDFSEKSLGLNKNYQKIFVDKNIKQDVSSEKYSEVNIRGSEICDDIKNAEVTIIITNSKIAGIKIDNYDSDSNIIYDIALKSFGSPANPPNFEKISIGYATYFDSENIYATYKYSKSGDKMDESILIMERDLMAKIDENNTPEENEK